MLNYRALELNDIEIVRKWRNENIQFLRQQHLLSQIEQEEWFKSDYLKRNKMYMVTKNIMQPYNNRLNKNIYEEKIAFAGLTYIDSYNKKTELSLIGYDYINKYCKEIVNKMVNIAFNEMEFDIVYNEVYEYDEKKIKLWKDCGFEKTGIIKNHILFNSRYYDTFIYSIRSF